MILDNLDVKILCTIWEDKETTTWKIAEKYFNHVPIDRRTKEERRLLNSQHIRIIKKIIKLSRNNIISITKSDPNNKLSKNVYTLILKNIKICRHKFPDKYTQALCLRMKGKWEVFEI